MTIEQVEEYIEREWNHPNGVYDRVITDVPGCARFVVHSQQYSPERSIDNMICYWFRKS